MKYINSIMAIIFLSYIFSSILQSGYFLNITFFLGMLELFGGHSWLVFSSFSFFFILWSCALPPSAPTRHWQVGSYFHNQGSSPFPLHLKHRVLTKSLDVILLMSRIYLTSCI